MGPVEGPEAGPGQHGGPTMAGSVNKVILLGNLGRDPEVRYTQDNRKIVHLSVATSERWTDRASGERRERTEWHRVVIFNEQLAEIAERYLTKGRAVYIEGQLQTRRWTDRDGQERWTTEVVIPRFRGELVLLGGRGEAAGPGEPEADPALAGDELTPEVRAPRAARSSPGAAGGGFEDLDDDIPF